MQAWTLLREKQNEIIKQVRPDLYPKFVEANDHYSNLVGLQKAAATVGLKEAVKQSNLLGILNPLTLLSKTGKAIGSVTGADKFINNLPMKLNPAIAAFSGKVGWPASKLNQASQLELSNYLESKYGKKGQ